MERYPTWLRLTCVAFLLSGLLSAEAWAGRRVGTAGQAERGSGFTLGSALRLQAQQDAIPLLCFDSLLTTVMNPACFTTTSPGDCVSRSQHFFVQYFDPIDYLGADFGTHRVTGMAFITNDGATVFPSGGVVVRPYNPNDFFPTPAELGALQVRNIQSPHDTAVVYLDLQSANLTFTPDDVMFVCLQFPEGGKLRAPFDGPGIANDVDGADSFCDFFTLDSGTEWWEPSVNYDWGFELDVEPQPAVEGLTWSQLKVLFRDP